MSSNPYLIKPELPPEPPRKTTAEKFREKPILLVGAVGYVGAIVYGIYNFRKRKGSAQMYLIHLRVGSQAIVVGALGIAVFYDEICKFLDYPEPNSDTKH